MNIWKELFIIGIITFSLEALLFIVPFIIGIKIIYGALIWMIFWGIWSIVCYINWQKEVEENSKFQ